MPSGEAAAQDRASGLMRPATMLATIGGLGRIPGAPGTWGSLVGLGIGLWGVQFCSMPVAAALLVVTLLGCVVVCSQAERELRVHDAPAIILDEVWAMAAVVLLVPRIAISATLLALSFALFRIFDIFKPPPLQHLARLPAGWGVMADDLGAAGYSIFILYALQALVPSLR